jgi:hypothetical protein
MLHPHASHHVLTQAKSTSAATAATAAVLSAVLLATPQQQVPAYSALALVHATLAAATCFAPGWAMVNMFDWLPTTATAMQLVIAPGAYLWLVVACLVCLKVRLAGHCSA